MTIAIAPPPALDSLLLDVRHDARRRGLGYAGDVDPHRAWTLFSRREALLVDVRTAEERHYVGRVPRSLHVAWATGFPMKRNPRFVDQLLEVVDREAVVLLICRSGKRSVDAAVAAAAAGYAHAFNVLEGFEGEADDDHRRGTLEGWRFRGLPWVQD